MQLRITCISSLFAWCNCKFKQWRRPRKVSTWAAGQSFPTLFRASGLTARCRGTGLRQPSITEHAIQRTPTRQRTVQKWWGPPRARFSESEQDNARGPKRSGPLASLRGGILFARIVCAVATAVGVKYGLRLRSLRSKFVYSYNNFTKRTCNYCECA